MPLPVFKSQVGHVRKLPVTSGKAVVFAGYSSFLHYLQLASHYLAVIWQEKLTIIEIPMRNSTLASELGLKQQGVWASLKHPNPKKKHQDTQVFL